MLGYPTVFIGCFFRVNRRSHARNLSALRFVVLLTALWVCGMSLGAPVTRAQQARRPAGKGGTAEIYADGPQSRRGDLFIADGNVDIRYGGQRLRADHVEYNDRTNEAYAHGRVQFDYENQHLEGDEAHYNVGTGRGTFVRVRGTVKIERRANPTILVTDNPLYFEAREVEKFGNDLYFVREAWITVCDPRHPKWQFYATHARIRVDKTMALVNVNFRLVRVPLVWLPYATAPAGAKIRESGFLIPTIGNSSSKGFVFGDALYWAPTSWMDTTLAGELFSRRGWAQRGQLRAKPFENTSIKYSYFGVIDRGVPTVINAGLPNQATVRESQGGHEQQLEVQSLIKDNWRFVTDLNELSSLTFRLAFADTFGDAINSEVRSSIFLTHNLDGFSLNLAALTDRSFLQINPQTSVVLRNSPEARFSSVERSPWRNLPIYFGFDAFAGAVHRQDQNIDTAAAVARTELAPRVSVPLRFGPWLNVTTTAAFRTAYYGDSLASPVVLRNQSITRNDGEFTVDFQLPTLERFFDRRSVDEAKPRRRYKHTIEPEVTYRYVTGIDHFSQFVRFDGDATLTNTNEIEYGVTQRLWRKEGEDQPQELASWRLVQKRYFDPTFGGAIVDGKRNVFDTLDSVTPFAFALGPRNSSPIISDFKITPAGRYDTEQILEYDPQLHKITTIGTLVKVKPYKEFFATIAHFRLQADPILQPLSNQVRVLMGYGGESRRGFNVTTGVSYDITNSSLQNQLVRLSYNGSCCGLAVEYRRIALGQVRTDNQFRVAFIIANIGTFGNLRHQEKIF
jgi:LPS-assembly protein